MKLIDKDLLLEELDEAIKDFIPKNDDDNAFLQGVVAARRIVKFMPDAEKTVKVSTNDEGHIVETFERPDGSRYTVEHLGDG